ncbi:MAG: (d)CMP kinase [Phycisphaerales bacterium]|nr:(d)CMP kinase [Phycisphaerales bacterium]
MTTASSVIITIDGPAGTGKSSVSHQLAKRLGLQCLDTGAMYRCVTLMSIRESIDPLDGDALVAALEQHSIEFDWDVTPPQVLLDGLGVEDEIRGPEVAQRVSIVATVGVVREAMVTAQRRIAAAHRGIISEGRDQGSVVFPDADVRFFLIADASIRARRRVSQLQAQGKHADLDTIEAEIRSRDEIDSGRAIGPLVCPDGAVEIDTTELTLHQVVDRLEHEVRHRVDAAVLASC